MNDLTEKNPACWSYLMDRTQSAWSLLRGTEEEAGCMAVLFIIQVKGSHHFRTVSTVMTMVGDIASNDLEIGAYAIPLRDVLNDDSMLDLLRKEIPWFPSPKTEATPMHRWIVTIGEDGIFMGYGRFVPLGDKSGTLQ